MISLDDIKNTALLSKLEIKDEELETLRADMEKIIDFANEINSAPDFDDNFDNTFCDENRLRDDEVKDSYPNEEILFNARDKQDGYFLLKNK